MLNTKASFWINAYQSFDCKDNPNRISLDYVLFNYNSGIINPYINLQYDNMLYAQIDAVVFPIARMSFGGIEVRVC
jgi:hypothetical protein